MTAAELAAYRAASPAEQRRIAGKVLQANEPLVLKMAATFAQRSNLALDPEDLRQAARIGVLQALARWQPTRGAWSTVCVTWARHEMQQVARHATPVTIPKSAYLPRADQNAAATFATRHGREPEPHEAGVEAPALRRAQQAAATYVRPDQVEPGALEDGWAGLHVGGNPADGIEAVIDARRALRAIPDLVSAPGGTEGRFAGAARVRVARARRRRPQGRP